MFTENFWETRFLQYPDYEEWKKNETKREIENNFTEQAKKGLRELAYTYKGTFGFITSNIRKEIEKELRIRFSNVQFIEDEGGEFRIFVLLPRTVVTNS